MKFLFGKLATLQALGYSVGQLRTTLECDNDLGSIQIDVYKQMIAERNQEIFDLQNEIIDMVNNLNGEKVF